MSVYRPTFQERKTFGDRKRMSADCMRTHVGKLPVIIERFPSEKNLPLMERCQFLVEEYATFAEVVSIIRKRLQLTSEQSIVLFANETTIPSSMGTVNHFYQQYKHEDGFLYLTYATQSYFG